MAYVKTNWQTGDVITAAKLNNMETGIYDAAEAAAAAFAPDIDDPQDGDVIKYDSTAEKWVNGKGGGSFAPDITNPQDGQVIVYDATAGKWVNGPDTNGEDFVITCTVTGQDFSGTIDKTQEEINAAYLAHKNFKLSVPAMGIVAVPTVFELSNPGTASLIVRAMGDFIYSDASYVYMVHLVTSDIETYHAYMYQIATVTT